MGWRKGMQDVFSNPDGANAIKASSEALPYHWHACVIQEREGKKTCRRIPQVIALHLETLQLPTVNFSSWQQVLIRFTRVLTRSTTCSTDATHIQNICNTHATHVQQNTEPIQGKNKSCSDAAWIATLFWRAASFVGGTRTLPRRLAKPLPWLFSFKSPVACSEARESERERGTKEKELDWDSKQTC